MSLEEKKNLAWSQEQTRKWNTTSKEPLKPKPDPATSFINSNLQSLSSSKTMDSYPSLNSMPSYSPNMSNISPNVSNMNIMSSNLNMSPQPPLSLSGSYSSFMSSPPQPQGFAFQNVPPGPQSLDLRSLDSLLPNIGTKPSIPMSQMSSRPIAPVNIVPKIPSPPSYSSPVSSSAKNELDDLLG